MRDYKIKVFKVKLDSICEATTGYCSMNECSEHFESYVINIERTKYYYLVTVKSSFDYPYITNQWKKWLVKEERDDTGKN